MIKGRLVWQKDAQLPEGWKQRQRVLTDADLLELAKLVNECHVCRFDNINPEDMDFLKDLLGVYKETRSEIIKWLVKGAMFTVMVMICLFAWLKYGSKH